MRKTPIEVEKDATDNPLLKEDPICRVFWLRLSPFELSVRRLSPVKNPHVVIPDQNKSDSLQPTIIRCPLICSNSCSESVMIAITIWIYSDLRPRLWSFLQTPVHSPPFRVSVRDWLSLFTFTPAHYTLGASSQYHQTVHMYPWLTITQCQSSECNWM